MKGISLILFVASWSLVASLATQRQGAPRSHPFQFPFFQDLSNFFGGSGFPNTHTHPHSHSNGYYGNSYNQHRRTHLVCPEQLEDAYIATYSYNFSLYPVNEITAELDLPANANLKTCLLTHSVPVGVPPVVPNPVLDPTNATCAYNVHRLASFDKYGGRCWIIENFQESIYYVRCKSTMCQNCNSKYYYRSAVKRCLHGYRFESVWVYCDGRPINTRIVRERIVVPESCGCGRVYCNTVYYK